jgi:hypothetical protein
MEKLISALQAVRTEVLRMTSEGNDSFSGILIQHLIYTGTVKYWRPRFQQQLLACA